MKRSRSLVLTLMAPAGLSLTACDGPGQTQQAAQGSWINPPEVTQAADEGRRYRTLAACKRDDSFTDQQCDDAFKAAQTEAGNGPQFADQQSCEARYGVEQCVPRQNASGGSVWGPLLTGFIVGQALNNLGGGRAWYGDYDRYRDRRVDYGGGSYGGGYLSGRRYGESSYEAPARTQSRSSVISRGGFGGGRGFGG